MRLTEKLQSKSTVRLKHSLLISKINSAAYINFWNVFKVFSAVRLISHNRLRWKSNIFNVISATFILWARQKFSILFNIQMTVFAFTLCFDNSNASE